MQYFSESLNDRVVSSGYPSSNATPEIAWLSADRYVVVWQASVHIYARVYAATGEPVGEAFVVGQTWTGGLHPIDVEATAGGGFFVSWPDYVYNPATSSGSHAIVGVGFDSVLYTPLSPAPVKLTAATSDGSPVRAAEFYEGGHLAINGSGEMFVTYNVTKSVPGTDIFSGTFRTEVYGQKLDQAGGLLGSPFQVSPAQSNSSLTSFKMLANTDLPAGGYAVAYSSQPRHDLPVDKYFAQVYTGFGAAGSPIQLSFVPTDLAYVGHGYLVAVGTGASDTGVVAQLLDLNGNIVSQPFSVAPTGTSASAAGFEDGDDGFIVTWIGPDGVRAQAFTTDADINSDPTGNARFKVMGEIQVTASTNGNDVAVAAGPDGSFAISWTGNSGVLVDTFIPFIKWVGTSSNDVFIGGNKDEWVVGNSGNDVLSAGGGDDLINGGFGNDVIIGGAGGDVFRGTVHELAGDSIRDFAVGDRIHIMTDQWTEIEFTQVGSTITLSTGQSFNIATGGSMRLALTTGDFAGYQLVFSRQVTSGDASGDGFADLLWRNSDGTLASWNGAAGRFVATDFALAVSPAWQVDATGDFNGDGRTDMLWRHADGTLTQWLSDGSSFNGAGQPSLAVSLDWQVEGTGDFNGDGRDDILWRNDDGRVTQWLGVGNGFNGAGQPTLVVAKEWQVEGLGDFDGDGKDDILWRHTDGRVTQWLGVGNGFNGAGQPTLQVSSDWQIGGLGDFDGDGRDDILWRNDDGRITQWLGVGNGFNGAGQPTLPVSNDWNVAAVGDYSGDGRDDLIWRNENGAMTTWLGVGNGFDGAGQPVYFVGNEWDVII